MNRHFNHDEPYPIGTIFSSKKRSNTKRDLAVVRERCKFCGHGKALVNLSINAKVAQKCSRCKR